MSTGWADEQPTQTQTTSVQPKQVVINNEPKNITVENKVKNKPVTVIFDDKAIEKWLFNNEFFGSKVCCGIYGFDGTAKTGIALDCRSPEEIEKKMKVIIIDLDGGAKPLKAIYHNNDENIIIRNPTIRGKDSAGMTTIDYEMTFERIRSTVDYLQRNMEKLNLKAIIFDGVDKFLKICEYSMREDVGEKVKKEVGVEDGVDYRYWKIRNQKYLDIIEQIKMLDCDRYFITHLKTVDKVTGNLKTTELQPDWEKHTSDMLFQKIKCWRDEKVEDGNKVVYIKAKIEKSKTNIKLEGKEFVIAKITQKPKSSESEWYGMKFENNEVKQREVK